MQIVKWAVAAAAASVLAGCASQPEIPFDKSANASLHTIGIVTPSMPDRPNIWLASDMGQSFGLIGALIDVSMQEARNSKVEAMLKSRGIDPKDNFEKSLEASLKAQGFDVKPVAVARKQGEALKTYPAAADTGADAYLDISVLMQDAIFYDPVAPFGQGKNVSISPDPVYTFVDFDTMRSKPDQVVSGIDASMQQTTDALGRLLR